MPRILITGFCALPGPNRPGVQMRYVMDALARHHTVDVLVVRHGEQAYVERLGNARILRVPISEDNLRGQVNAFRRALKRQLDGADYEIIHFRDGWSGRTIIDEKARLEYATVFDATRAPVAEAPMMDLELGAELSQDEERCMRESNLVLVPTETAKQHVAGGDGDAERIFVVPPGVDIDRFDWDDEPTGQPVVLYAGSIEPGRGVRVLIRAMAYVAQELDARFVLAGFASPEFRATLEHAINELGLAGRVEIAGEVEHDDMPALIARSSVCIAPAAPESRSQPMALYPTKLLEYMACRRPVIAPRRGTAAMLIQDGESGLLFNPGDPADLADKIVKMANDSKLSDSLAEGGYELVRRSYTASAVRRCLRKAYTYLVDKAPWGKRLGHVTDHPRHAPSLPVDLSLSDSLTDSMTDNTDEYEAPFSERGFDRAPIHPGDITSVEPPMPQIDDLDDLDGLDGGTWVTATNDLPTQEQMAQDLVDEWVVEVHTANTAPSWRMNQADEEGTPVDVTPAPPATTTHTEPIGAVNPDTDSAIDLPNTDSAIDLPDADSAIGPPIDPPVAPPVARVASPVPIASSDSQFVAGELEVASTPGDLAVELEDEASFTAVSVMLGNINDDTDGAGTNESG